MLNTIWQKYLTRADKILLLVLLVLALSSYSLLRFLKNPGERVVLEVNKKPIASFSLKQEGKHTVQGKLGDVTLQIKAGAVRILEAPCPRRVCQQMGWIKNSGEVIVCLPNQLIMRIGEKDTGDFDAIAH